MILVALTFFIWGIQTASAQTWGIKTNALYDATRTVNIGTEFALGKKWTLDVSGNYNGWNAGSRCEKMKHFMVQPELRYWTCDVFNGHFFALHAMGGGYNISNVRFPFFTRKFDDGNRYEGWFVGAGVGYGYSWVLGKRWNLEAESGLCVFPLRQLRMSGVPAEPRFRYAALLGHHQGCHLTDLFP